MRLHSSRELNVTLFRQVNGSGIAVSCPKNYKTPVRLTFTNSTNASPSAIVPTNTCGRTDKMVALGTSEMDLMSNKILWSKLGSMSRGFQGGAGGGSCGRETESTRGRRVTCGVSLPTSSGILCLGIYTCHWAAQGLHGKGRFKCLIYSQSAEEQSLYESELHQQPSAMLCCMLWRVQCLYNI